MQLTHQAVFSVGSLEVRPSTREAVWAGAREVLQPRLMQVLVALALAGGEVGKRQMAGELPNGPHVTPRIPAA